MSTQRKPLSAAWLRASMRTWQQRLAARRRLLRRARRRGDLELVERRAAHVAEAERTIARRRKQLADVSPPRPRIITAAQLGLRFQWLWGSVGPIYRRTGHYTAGPRARDATELIRIGREVHAQHVRQRWGGGSYWAMIADDGAILLLNPVGRKAAHVASNNTGNLGINCPGTTGDEPTAEQRASYRWLVAHAHTREIPKAWRSPVDLRRVARFAHNDLNATACPGAFKPMFKAS